MRPEHCHAWYMWYVWLVQFSRMSEGGPARPCQSSDEDAGVSGDGDVSVTAIAGTLVYDTVMRIT